jgi:competence protein ComEA
MQMPTISRRRALAYAASALVLLAVGGRLLAPDSPPAGGDDARKAPAHSLKAEPERARKVVVHVVGAVRRPGLYRLREGSRVDDAVRRAGGIERTAALDLVNLAAPVADGQQIMVPSAREAGRAGVKGSPSGTSAASPETIPPPPVHLNSATLEELDALPGVGPVTAQKILDYRTANGAFSSVDELDAVSGIGPARLEQLKPLVDL